MDRLDQIMNRLTTIETHLVRKVTRWISVEEAAKYLAVSSRTIRRYLEKGVVPLHKLPTGSVRIDRNDLDSLVLYGRPYRKLTRPQRELIIGKRDL